jgi:hypothetical protein
MIALSRLIARDLYIASPTPLPALVKRIFTAGPPFFMSYTFPQTGR